MSDTLAVSFKEGRKKNRDDVGHAFAEPAAAQQKAPKRTVAWLMPAAVVAAVALLSVFFLGRQTKTPVTPPPQATAPSAQTGKIAIVVLPFVNLSADPDQEYFFDGLTEELLNVLAKNPKLQVISRTYAFFFKGKNVDMKTVAEKLHVTHVLEGSVRKAGNQLRTPASSIQRALNCCAVCTRTRAGERSCRR